MVTTKTPDPTWTHLVLLAVVLRHRGWRAAVERGDRSVVLTVTNPAAPAAAGRIVCRNSVRGWRFCWSGRQEIGPADKIAEVADKITDLLGGEERQ